MAVIHRFHCISNSCTLNTIATAIGMHTYLDCIPIGSGTIKVTGYLETSPLVKVTDTTTSLNPWSYLVKSIVCLSPPVSEENNCIY